MPNIASAKRERCDDSGLCEELDALQTSDRLVSSCRVGALLVDICPMRAGHCLVATKRHVPRSASLSAVDFSDLQDFLKESATLIRAAFGMETMFVEHGAADGMSLWDCVCHAHIHLVPIVRPGNAPLVDSVVDTYMTHIVRVDTAAHPDLHDLLIPRREYLTITLSGQTWIGAPKPRIRHGSRHLIAALCNLSEDLVDWGIVPHGHLFTESIRTFSSHRDSHV